MPREIDSRLLPQIQKGLSEVFSRLAKKVWLFGLALLLLDLIWGGLIFYRYDFLIQQKEIIIPEKIPIFKKDLYEQVTRVRDENAQRFQEIGLKTYPDLFRPELTK